MPDRITLTAQLHRLVDICMFLFPSLRSLRSTTHISAPAWLFLDSLKYQGILDSSSIPVCLPPPVSSLYPQLDWISEPLLCCVGVINYTAWKCIHLYTVHTVRCHVLLPVIDTGCKWVYSSLGRTTPVETACGSNFKGFNFFFIPSAREGVLIPVHLFVGLFVNKITRVIHGSRWKNVAHWGNWCLCVCEIWLHWFGVLNLRGVLGPGGRMSSTSSSFNWKPLFQIVEIERCVC